MIEKEIDLQEASDGELINCLALMLSGCEACDGILITRYCHDFDFDPMEVLRAFLARGTLYAASDTIH
jgi:hypothetical protein